MREKKLHSFPKLAFPHGFWYHFLSFPLGLCFLIHLLSFLCSNSVSLPAPALSQINILNHLGEINCAVIVLRWFGERWKPSQRIQSEGCLQSPGEKQKESVRDSERKHREHVNQRGFCCQNDSYLVVIYDFALFSHSVPGGKDCVIFLSPYLTKSGLNE